MKLFIFLALAVFTASAAPADDVDVAGDVTDIINQILDALPEPLLDIHDSPLNLDLGFEVLNFTFDDVVLSGLKNLEISTMDYDSTSGRLDFELTIAEITVDLKFTLLLSGILEAVNTPVVDIDLTDTKLTGYAVVDTEADPNKVTDFKVLLTLGGSKVDLSGILNDDQLTEKLNTLLNESLTDGVNEIAEKLEPALSPLIRALINLLISLDLF